MNCENKEDWASEARMHCQNKEEDDRLVTAVFHSRDTRKV